MLQQALVVLGVTILYMELNKMTLQMSTGLKEALLAKEEERKKRQEVLKASSMTLTTGSIFEENTNLGPDREFIQTNNN